jgi:hypothetical protein
VTDQETVLYFVDETGDPGFGSVIVNQSDGAYTAELKPSPQSKEAPSEDYCIGWIQILKTEAEELVMRLQRDWKKVWGKQLPPDEPKWKDIDGYGAALKTAVYDSFASILEETSCVIGAYYYNKVGTVTSPLISGVHSLLSLSKKDLTGVYQSVLLLRAGATLCTHSMSFLRPSNTAAEVYWDKIIGENRMKLIEIGFRYECPDQHIAFINSTASPCIWVSEFVARQVADLFRKGHPSCALHRLATKFTKMPSVDGKGTCHCVACDWESGKSYIYDISRNEIRNEIKWDFDLEKLNYIQP